MQSRVQLSKDWIETIKRTTEGERMKKKRELLNFLAEKIREIVRDESDKDEKLRAICKLLRDNVSHYD